MSGPPSAEKDNPWGALHVHVLPLFNRDPLRIPIEDLNALVRKQIVAVISRNPSKAVAQLEADVSELITAGMVTLNSKLAAGVDEEKLAARIVDLWGFFWDQVLPYVEGIFLPLQTDPYLQSLARTPKTNRPSSPSPNAISFDAAITSQSGTGGYSPGYSAFGGSSTSIGGSNISVGQSIDVRKLALRAFRDSVVLPVSTKLQKRFSTPSKDGNLNSDLSEHHKPRLEQMLLVLSSIATHNISLTSTTPTVTSQLATPGELAVTTLLRLVLYPPGTGQQPHQLGSSAFGQRLPSFLSSGAPRDRRGRLARRSIQVAQREVTNEELGGEGSMTTIGGGGGRTHVEGLLSIGMSQREREGRELLESLRSPNLDVDERPEEIGMGESGNGAEGGGEGAGNSVMMESLGTGPGGWGAGPPNTTQDLVASGQPPPPAKDMNPSRRAAIYEDVGRLIDEDSDTYDERSVISGVPMIVETQPLNLRRPSRIETDGDADTERREPERRPRI
ncbi:hypothetical protein FRC19_003370 [Serendipita sp. 401]|nr:hypothetical protein FRC19_003370 [Serendipita sp. 401]